jgi:uncharacterized protein (DUF488 family)
VTLFTVGHSTRSMDAFLAVLASARVQRVVDVRSVPGSRRNPHFGQHALEASLAAAGIAYEWRKALGGWRRRRKDSRHTAWRVAAFAGYADYMETEAFVRAATELLTMQATAIMCAEARPEQCHRRLISDWCTIHGVTVIHLLSERRRVVHVLTPFARVESGALIYDGGQPSLI